MNTVIAFTVLAALLSAIMSLAWLIALRTGRSGWIDAIWSFAVGGVGALAVFYPASEEAYLPRQLLVAGLALFWSIRLGAHIAVRTAGEGADDPRYRQLREEWGDSFRSRLFLFLQIQAAAAFILVVSVAVAARNPEQGLGVADLIGAMILVVSVAGEGLADRQLARFRAENHGKGRVCDEGLWGLSRHPNYFFEWLAWLAWPAIALGAGFAYPLGLLAFAGAAMMYWLLVHVSGIPPLEAHMLRSRGEAFRRYQARVNAFWPWPARQAEPAQAERTPR